MPPPPSALRNCFWLLKIDIYISECLKLYIKPVELCSFVSPQTIAGIVPVANFCFIVVRNIPHSLLITV